VPASPVVATLLSARASGASPRVCPLASIWRARKGGRHPRLGPGSAAGGNHDGLGAERSPALRPPLNTRGAAKARPVGEVAGRLAHARPAPGLEAWKILQWQFRGGGWHSYPGCGAVATGAGAGAKGGGAGAASLAATMGPARRLRGALRAPLSWAPHGPHLGAEASWGCSAAPPRAPCPLLVAEGIALGAFVGAL